MTRFSLGLLLGSLAPAVGIYLAGGSALACFALGAAVTVLPTVWITRFCCPRKVVMRPERGTLKVTAAREPGRPPKVAVTTEGGEIESALRNFGCPKQKARQIAAAVPPGDFDTRMRAALQMARAA